MARILLIETSTAQLSTALSEDGTVTASRISGEPRMQAALTAPFVKEVLDERGLKTSDLDAVCVGKGPGSYTGLRVGVSTAKGLCFGAGIPLLSAGTLDILVQEAHRLGVVPEGCRYIVPMVDARRMEVYTAVFTPEGRQLTETRPIVVEAGSFAAELAEGPVLFIGDGALKCREMLTSPNAFFADAFPSALAMAPLAEAAYAEKRFEDVAYFEPFYLKDFVATVSRKKLF
ncbi:MAG: tRNA (adenosine(37)-N6)-threonylcarbamoyltransferase complex dimerization subunit type 1 TsaB [Bacteroidales bacterium]|nr:tRNA (adenosine(37)-N6)-threonylcarbamoyltransferase complex dimerization subunit type 1 TsaB [Bacteroidales bacterium]